jgi:hypothetical protein
MVDGLTTSQQAAYGDIVRHLDGRAGRQLVGFLSGEGGTGKSHLIKTLDMYTRVSFGKTPGTGGFGACLKIAPTGCAANNINGFTWQAALNKQILQSKKKKQDDSGLDQTQGQRLQKKLEGLRLIILDEVSMVSAEGLADIDRRLRAAFPLRPGEASKPFGGRHILFSGDLYQLPSMGTCFYGAVRGTPTQDAAKGLKLWSQVTSFYELLQNKRHGDDLENLPPLARFLKSARIGKVNT